MEQRFAFTAQFWGDGGVVCRAFEDRPGPVADPQFGEFQSWTQAQNFAAKLNEGLDLDPLTVRRIVTSSILATACVVQEALDSISSWRASKTEMAARSAQLQCALAQLALALTMCRSASYLPETAARRVLLHTQRVLDDSTHFLKLHDADYDQLKGIATGTVSLQSAIHQLSASLPPCLPALSAQQKLH